MIRHPLVILLCVLLLISWAPLQPTAAQPSDPPATAPAEPKYKKPRWGRSGTRVVNAGRGVADADGGRVLAEREPVDVVLPDHLAGTAARRPGLYWFLYEPVEHPCELTLTDTKAMKTKAVRVDRVAPGLHRANLAEFDLPLQPGREYEFQVELIVNENDPEQDAFVKGSFTYVELSPELARRLEGATPEQRAALLAEAGLWIDALDATMAGLEADPSNERLRQLRAELLSEEGLERVAQDLVKSR